MYQRIYIANGQLMFPMPGGAYAQIPLWFVGVVVAFLVTLLVVALVMLATMSSKRREEKR